MFSSKGYSICAHHDCDEPAVAGQQGHRRCRVHQRAMQKAQRRRKRAAAAQSVDPTLPARVWREST